VGGGGSAAITKNSLEAGRVSVQRKKGEASLKERRHALLAVGKKNPRSLWEGGSDKKEPPLQRSPGENAEDFSAFKEMNSKIRGASFLREPGDRNDFRPLKKMSEGRGSRKEEKGFPSFPREKRSKAPTMKKRCKNCVGKKGMQAYSKKYSRPAEYSNSLFTGANAETKVQKIRGKG